MAPASASPLPPVPLGLVLHAWACLPVSDLLRIRAVSKSWRAGQADNTAQLRELRRYVVYAHLYILSYLLFGFFIQC
jgi:hypothetical protein